jgi:hypothetical protein
MKGMSIFPKTREWIDWAELTYLRAVEIAGEDVSVAEFLITSDIAVDHKPMPAQPRHYLMQLTFWTAPVSVANFDSELAATLSRRLWDVVHLIAELPEVVIWGAENYSAARCVEKFKIPVEVTGRVTLILGRTSSEE